LIVVPAYSAASREHIQPSDSGALHSARYGASSIAS
jgi:hypothetical protein